MQKALAVWCGDFAEVEVVDVVFGDFVEMDIDGEAVGGWHGLSDARGGLVHFGLP